MKNEKDEVDDRSQVPKPVDSVLLYDNPQRIVKHDKFMAHTSRNIKKPTLQQRIINRSCSKITENTVGPCIVDSRIINQIIPSVKTTIGLELFTQEASSCPSKDLDVLHLQEKLNEKLIIKGAKMTGICSIRRKLFDELFTEIIRQVTIECMERGLLLSRVNEEINLTLTKMRQIYESGSAYGINKTLQDQNHLNAYEKQVNLLQNTIEKLKTSLTDIHNHIDKVQEVEKEKMQFLVKKNEVDYAFMKKNYDLLKQQLIEAIESIKHPDLEE